MGLLAQYHVNAKLEIILHRKLITWQQQVCRISGVACEPWFQVHIIEEDGVIFVTLLHMFKGRGLLCDTQIRGTGK
jgi:hypothetical protein